MGKARLALDYRSSDGNGTTERVAEQVTGYLVEGSHGVAGTSTTLVLHRDGVNVPEQSVVVSEICVGSEEKHLGG